MIPFVILLLCGTICFFGCLWRLIEGVRNNRAWFSSGYVSKNGEAFDYWWSLIFFGFGALFGLALLIVSLAALFGGVVH